MNEKLLKLTSEAKHALNWTPSIPKSPQYRSGLTVQNIPILYIDNPFKTESPLNRNVL